MSRRHASVHIAVRERTSGRDHARLNSAVDGKPADDRRTAHAFAACAAVAEIAAGVRDTISLEELRTASLLDRVDRKFLLPVHRAPEVVRRCSPYYRILEVEGRRLSLYRTVYYDTPDIAFYHAHHTGRASRHKVRTRTYVDTAQSFAEVKRRTNKGRTFKVRARLLDDPLHKFDALDGQAELAAAAIEPSELQEVLSVRYTRLTLVSRSAIERVTLDLMLEFRNETRTAAFPDLVIAEVKQQERQRSPFLTFLREAHVRETSISKYCLGVVSLDPTVKQNRFKGLLRLIQRTVGDAGPSVITSPQR